jgi:S-adenosylmethionine hydrolase
MKGVIKAINKQVEFIDLTHQIPPGDIQRGAFILWQSAGAFAEGTTFLSVVDPGVGTLRKAILLETMGQHFIGPDNGLFSYLTLKNDYAAWELSNPKYQLKDPSTTFHGRDFFAPAAAYVSTGIKSSRFGNPLEKLTRLSKPNLSLGENSMSGEIISTDRFGNLITSLGRFRIGDGTLIFDSWVENFSFVIDDQSKIRIVLRDMPLPIVNTFDSVPDGGWAGLIGSSGLVEIVTNQASAAYTLGVKIGDPVSIVW